MSEEEKLSAAIALIAEETKIAAIALGGITDALRVSNRAVARAVTLSIAKRWFHAAEKLRCIMNERIPAQHKEESMKSFHPFGNLVLIREIPREHDSAPSGQIIIPDTIAADYQRGEVVAVGEGNYNASGERTPCNARVGDVVIYRAQGIKLTVDGAPRVLLRDGELLGRSGG